MTVPNDPAQIQKNFHENTADDEYMCWKDKNSSVKLTNLVTTAKAGQALPFKNVEEFKNYVIENES